MGRIGEVVEGMKPVMLMVFVQASFAGVNVFYKLGAADGMSLRVIVAYRFIFSSAFMLPLALIFERKNRPKLSWIVIFQAFLCGLFGGTLTQNMYIVGLDLTSATLASAIANLNPIITFLLAITFGMEKVGIKTLAGKAKVVGTLTGLGGAMVLTFVKGIEVPFWSTHGNILKHGHPTSGTHVSSPSHSSFILGCLLLVGQCFTYSTWLIVQTKMSVRYPRPYTCTLLMSIMASIQCVAYAMCVEKDRSQWRLGWNIRLLTVAYAGIVVAGISGALITWCVRKRDPLFVSSFYPLMLVLSAIADCLLLGGKLYLGSVVGATLVVSGLYTVVWGKNKELKMSKLLPIRSFNEEDSVKVVTTSTNNKNGCKDSVDKEHGETKNYNITSNPT